MAEKVPMTALSPTMEEGTIISWSKKEGDTVTAGDVLCEVETDKTSVEYESSQEGVLLKIIVGVDGSAAVGQTIAIIGEKGEDTSEILAQVESEKGSSATGSGVSAPDEAGREASSGKESSSGKKEKAAAESESKAGGSPEEPEQPAGSAPAGSAPTGSGSESSEEHGGTSRIKASPLAVKLAAERNISLALVKGTGTGGRIVQRDIEQFRGVPGGAGTLSESSGGDSVPGDQVLPVSGKRAVIARRLSESMFTAPHYYVTTSVEMESVLTARKLLNDSLPKKVSLNAFFLKFVAEAIKRHREINSTWQGDTILQHGSVDIGLAVDLGNGLITPVVRNCGNRGVQEIEADLVDLIEKARTGKLKPEEYSGATFTISNLGSFGVEEFTAIINPPGSAILALGASKLVPVARQDGSIVAATVMKMTLSCDHRVIDGAAGARFLHELQMLMEQPARLLF